MKSLSRASAMILLALSAYAVLGAAMEAAAPCERECACSGGGLPDVSEIKLEGEYSGHLQDVWYDGGKYIYWAHTRDLLKTDLKGRIVKRVQVDGHHAGIQVKDGRVYVAVCLMQGKTGGRTTPECRVTVCEYDAETLSLVAKHVTDINDRSGSLTILDDGTFLVGCLRPQDIALTQVRFHHLDKDFKLIRSYVIDNAPVKLGIETLKRKGGCVYLGMYGGDKDGKTLGFDTIKLDRDYKEVWRGRLGISLGAIEDHGRLWVGKTVGRKVGTDSRKRLYTSSLIRTDKVFP